jgi:tetratricopeptide (TPR) repeat protein
MNDKVLFIGRKEEIEQIIGLAQMNNSRHVLGIQGEGGVGKTSILTKTHEILKEQSNIPITITDIIDFDAPELQTDDMLNLEAKLINNLGLAPFKSYFREVAKYHRGMKNIGVNAQALQSHLEQIHMEFISNYNDYAASQRIVVLIDTAEKIEFLQNLKKSIISFIGSAQNTLFIIAGRKTSQLIANIKENKSIGEFATLMNLPAFSANDSETFLREKQQKILHPFSKEINEKIILFSRGLPIFMDLAVEWLSRNEPLDWLKKISIKQINDLTHEEKEKLRLQFEAQLVGPIKRMRAPLDRLILVLSLVYPMDTQEILFFLRPSNELEVSAEDFANKLYSEAKTYVFVKSLPDEKITLHDEMRRMVLDHIWKDIDPDGDRKKNTHKQAVSYYSRKITEIEKQITKSSTTGKFDIINVSENSYTLESALWQMKLQKLHHLLLADNADGITAFKDNFDTAMNNNQYFFAGELVKEAEKYIAQLPSDDVIDINFRKARHLTVLGKNERQIAKRLLEVILEEQNLSTEYQLQTLLQLGNIEIRLGNVRAGIAKFKEIIRLGEIHQNLMWLIRGKNALGWAYRVMGDRDTAIWLYREARKLCDSNEIGGEIYGWILNNLAFVLAYRDRRSAIGLGELAVEHWTTLNNVLGLAAAKSSLGGIYYQERYYDRAMELLNEALETFTQLKNAEWMGRAHSGLGAILQDLNKYEEAEDHLKKSLELGSEQDKAMTLNRLGRVFMSRKEWSKAEEYMLQSFEAAQEIPDYVYWLGSLARLITITAEKKKYDRLSEFQIKLDEFNEICDFPDKNSLGIAEFGMARLALGQQGMDNAVKYLEKGIRDVVEYGSYAHTDVRKRLNYVEDDFRVLDPNIIRTIGKKLRDIFKQDTEINDVLDIRLRKWATWQNEKQTKNI